MPDGSKVQENDDVFGVDGVEEAPAQTASEEVIDNMMDSLVEESTLDEGADFPIQQFWFHKFAYNPLRNRHQGIHGTGVGDDSVQINGYSEMSERLESGWRVKTVQSINNGLEVFVALVKG